MKLLFVADLHYALKQFDWLVANAAKFDPVVIGGDLLDLASALDFDVQIVVVEKYLGLIGRKTRLIVSSGNHDGDSRSAADESVAQWIRESKSEGVFVDGDSMELPGARVTICPWWDGPASRAELEAQLASEAQKVHGRWIWIHHAPPAGSPVCWTGKTFGGDEVLLDWIKRFKPDMVLSGHIHNSPFYAAGAWVDRIGKTWVFNPGKQLGACPSYIALDFDEMTAEWISIEGQSIHRLAVADG
ncbi:MAG TPA: metallophosphoesterase [Candidatus Eisenbacteria bacterium]|nr:metallophosphoesterase [Candidatus Eisenbacteria bacterium]